MKKCTCSERPLMIVSAETVVRNGVPFEELKFACSNKNCSQYKKPVVRQLINLLDRKTTIEEDIEQ